MLPINEAAQVTKFKKLNNIGRISFGTRSQCDYNYVPSTLNEQNLQSNLTVLRNLRNRRFLNTLTSSMQC